MANSRFPKWLIVALAYCGVVVLFAGVTWYIATRPGMNWGDGFSFGQLAVEVIGLPLLLIGLYVSIMEFRKAQEKPDLDLHLATHAEPERLRGELSLDMPEAGVQTYHFFVELLNTGQAVAVWYLVEFRVPRELEYKEGIIDYRLQFLPIVGSKEHWRPWTSADQVAHTFMSGGTVAAYPHYGLKLAHVGVHLAHNRQYHRHYDIPYVIAVERGPLKKGVLRLRVRRPRAKANRQPGREPEVRA